MIKFLKKILGLCDHKWKIIKEIDLYIVHKGKEHTVGTKYVKQCEKCNKFSTKKVF